MERRKGELAEGVVFKELSKGRTSFCYGSGEGWWQLAGAKLGWDREGGMLSVSVREFERKEIIVRRVGEWPFTSMTTAKEFRGLLRIEVAANDRPTTLDTLHIFLTSCHLRHESMERCPEGGGGTYTI